MKDTYNALQPARQPGPLVPLLGGRVEQFYALNDDVPVSGVWGSGQARLWAEQLKAQGPANGEAAEVLLTYGESNGWLDGQPAVLSRKVGKGRITYIGAWLDDNLMRAAAQWMIRLAGLQPALGPVAQGVEVSRRVSATKEVFVLVNHTKRGSTWRCLVPCTGCCTMRRRWTLWTCRRAGWKCYAGSSIAESQGFIGLEFFVAWPFDCLVVWAKQGTAIRTSAVPTIRTGVAKCFSIKDSPQL